MTIVLSNVRASTMLCWSSMTESTKSKPVAVTRKRSSAASLTDERPFTRSTSSLP